MSYNYYQDEIQKTMNPEKGDKVQVKFINDKFTSKWLNLNQKSIPIIIKELENYLARLTENEE
jgi:aromatic ring-cleaving dioxygenase